MSADAPAPPSSTALVAAPGSSCPSGATPDRERQRELPLWDPREIETAAGLYRMVRGLVTMPLTTLGLLATMASLAVGATALAVLAGATTSLILYALWDDTRLPKALELVRRGEAAAAEEALLRVARARRLRSPQRERAQGVLAGLAWRRHDHEAALRWTQARRLSPEHERSPAAERFATRASEIQLLAVLGRADEAAAGLAELGSPPRDDTARLVEITTHLLVAFASGEVAPVEDRLSAWESVVTRCDAVGTATTLLAWARDQSGDSDRAAVLVEQARAVADSRHLGAHYPRLWRWLQGRDRVRRYG